MTPPLPLMKDQAWPANGLERVPDCPICGSSSRSLLHDGLSDQIFFVAPGEWNLWQCVGCRSAWLDPRPNEATIGIAYGRYYTHEEPYAAPTEPRNAYERLRAALGNGYRNRRYGTQLTPAFDFGWYFAHLVPLLRSPIDLSYRFLSAPSSRVKRVLDIGAGNGAWLELAQKAGWHIAAVETDAVARRRTKDRGIEVRESTKEWLDDPLKFDYITMSHVIEHVHDPLDLLSDSYSLLHRGGGLYIETPNIDARGHQIFGRHWRGLEPPRHLVLFNRDSLFSSVSRAGFRDIRYHTQLCAFEFTAAQSRRIAAGLDPYSSDTLQTIACPPGPIQRLQMMVDGSRSEFLTLTARKPK